MSLLIMTFEFFFYQHEMVRYNSERQSTQKRRFTTNQVVSFHFPQAKFSSVFFLKKVKMATIASVTID